MSEPTTLRGRLGQFIEARLTQRAIIALILLNALTLGLETSDTVMAWMGPVILAADTIILSIFTAEVLAKLFVYRLSFWRNPWNVFDFFVVGIALIPASGPFSVLRVLRLLRLVSMVPKLRFIVEALLRAIPGIISILGLLVLIFYVFAIIATGLFSESFPQKFGTLGATMYSLFQVMTLEGWSEDIARPVMEVYPWAWAFFVPFILIATFTVLNLFIAIIVDAMQRMHDRAIEIEQQMIHDSVHEENKALHSEIHELQQETVKLQERLIRMQSMLEKRVK
ncbi:Ion transport protein [Thioalkalivibrio sp. K90mix]|jgi:voltage-gated sodium channel|uniref:ion transporter n=1 Tax=unclassified Thioalkalivibrio TaxID=2621013 RepID=UPI000195A468|nr:MULTISPECIES: ion transporter [unclassified Thioalkalivibrio]ADC72198.1 Ion transport protein [Thioalkalivibrio sp. K90mix]